MTLPAKRFFVVFLIAFLVLAVCNTAIAGSCLQKIRDRGYIRHLGVPYANFVTGAGDGFSVELAKGFADHLGVDYKFVESSWSRVITDLTGKDYRVSGNTAKVVGDAPVKGDIIANGLTVLDWREDLLAYSSPTFRTQVWLLTRTDSSLSPITPGDDIQEDIAKTKDKLDGMSVLGVEGTCIDPGLYGLKKHGASTKLYDGNLNELAPAVLQGRADSTILDVPDSLVALQKWPGDFKIIGPITKKQNMGVGFRKGCEDLRRHFNEFLGNFRETGKYLDLVEKYYPTALNYFEGFFRKK